MKITPFLTIESIEKSLPFGVDRIGFEKTVEVPDGDRLAFVIVVRPGAELMLQTMETVRRGEPKVAPSGNANGATVFIEVDDFADELKRSDGYPAIMPERATFYGMRETGVRDPDGHIAVFAAKMTG